MMLSIPAAAALLQMHEETLRRHIRTGKVPVVRLKVGGQRIELKDLGVPKSAVAELEAQWRRTLEAVAASELER
ncbi:MAG TPA: helix-turn-helix domain-containing protein [Phycisphaerae bacterium]|nr:helix-turn-helix domain-containing protein [Phycisphaerae bacterium]